MVYRVYVEKKAGQTHEANALQREIQDFLGIHGLTGLRVVNRYDAENIDKELFDSAVNTVFSEPQVDTVFYDVPRGDVVFAVEPLPGQYDQRADSAAQCIQLISQQERPLIRTAKVYLLYGRLSDADLQAIKKYLINPVESREASLAEATTLETEYARPADVAILDGFAACSDEQLADYVKRYALAMDEADLRCCRDYFRSEQRDPSLTELRVEYSKRRVDENHFGPISYTEVEGARNEEPWVVCLWSGNER